MAMSPSLKKKLLPALIAAGIALLAWWAWSRLSDAGPGEGFVGTAADD